MPKSKRANLKVDGKKVNGAYFLDNGKNIIHPVHSNLSGDMWCSCWRIMCGIHIIRGPLWWVFFLMTCTLLITVEPRLWNDWILKYFIISLTTLSVSKFACTLHCNICLRCQWKCIEICYSLNILHMTSWSIEEREDGRWGYVRADSLCQTWADGTFTRLCESTKYTNNMTFNLLLNRIRTVVAAWM